MEQMETRQTRQQLQETRQEERRRQILQQEAREAQEEDSQLSTISVAPAVFIPSSMRDPIQNTREGPSTRDLRGSPPSNLTPRTPPAIPETPLPHVSPIPLSLPIRTPPTAERPRQRRYSSLETSPTSLYELPASTAPAKLGKSKRKRVHTAKYKESKASGLIPESQEAHRDDGKR